MNKKQWKTIYKELQKPQQLYSDDGNSVCVIGTYTRKEAFWLLKAELLDQYGEKQPEFQKLASPKQLRVGFLRRPYRDEGEDMDAIFVTEESNLTIPREHDVWIYDI